MLRVITLTETADTLVVDVDTVVEVLLIADDGLVVDRVVLSRVNGGIVVDLAVDGVAVDRAVVRCGDVDDDVAKVVTFVVGSVVGIGVVRRVVVL